MSANVLVPLDGTLLAEQAVPTATSIVRRRHGHLELMLVRHPRQRPGLEDWPWAVARPDTVDEYMEEQARQWGAVIGGVVGHTSVDGEVATEICRRAREIGADLIVMSTHGRTGFARVVGSSVANAVIRRAHVPVLLLRPPPPGRRPRRAPLRLERVLLPVDGPAVDPALRSALAGLIEPGTAEIYLLRVVAPVRESRSFALGQLSSGVNRTSTEAAAAVAEHELDDVATSLAIDLGCDVLPHVSVEDDPSDAISAFARRYNISLIAMATHGRGASRFVLGSVTDGVLRHAHLPMLVVRPPRADARH